LDRERFGHENLFLANFSCFGTGLTCAAPGVGIISTMRDVPGQAGLYGVMDGTSMASPVACGALASILATDNAYLGHGADLARSRAARAILVARCRDIGLSLEYQGRGLPFVQ
jgi:subtilisin